MLRTDRHARSAALALAVFCLTSDTYAQPPIAGSVTCVVRDASGAAIPGATVQAIDQGTKSVSERFTDVQGTARFTALPPGDYQIETRLDGFEPDTRKIILGTDPIMVTVGLAIARLTEGVVVTARRVEERAQDVPIPLSVLSGAAMANAGAFNVNHLKEMIPTVQFYSTNQRNSAINIRGLGSPFGLTNDGLEAGVGLYVDGVFYARPAAAMLDFIDVDQVEVLRGPQGTLFGKNTTAGAINITTRKPSFARGAEVEVNLGDLDFVQAKASITGPLAKNLAGRLSFSGTTRGGTIEQTRTHEMVNTLNNLGVRGQLLFAPSDAFALTIAADDTRQRPTGYTQVVAGVAPTQRPANRQYPQIAAGLGYTAPSFNAFDRVTDVDTPLRAYQDLGGVSATADWKAGPGRMTSTTAWRTWQWDPSSDRDFIGLPVTTLSAAPSTQRQLTQEIRYADTVSRRLSFVVGAFGFTQTIDSSPAFVQEQGSAAAAFLLPPGPAASTPGLLDGYGFRQYVSYANTSAAIFGQAQWSLTDRLRLLTGLRLNHIERRPTSTNRCMADCKQATRCCSR
jgi:iron complex outermembrane receptor protein